MANLFIDTSYNNIHLILEEDNKILAAKKIANIQKTSDVINDEIDKLLKEQKLSFKNNITSIYITKGPGSFTGVRIAVTIAKTLMVINKNIKVFTISSLCYQAGINKAISIIDARGSKYYVGIYEGGKEIIKDQILDELTLKDIAAGFSDYNEYRDMKSFDFQKNYLDLKPFFTKINNINDIEPIYIKKFL